jgi:hypothetical protein
MSNHFHLLLEVVDAPTARIIQSLVTGYVRRFNAINQHKGHLFQGRYKAIVCDRESYLLEPQALRRKGRAARLVEARDQFICQAVMEQGYRASEVAAFLHCHPSNTAGHCRKNR